MMEGEKVKFPSGRPTAVTGSAGLRTQVPGGIVTVSCVRETSDGLIDAAFGISNKLKTR